MTRLVSPYDASYFNEVLNRMLGARENNRYVSSRELFKQINNFCLDGIGVSEIDRATVIGMLAGLIYSKEKVKAYGTNKKS